MLELRSLGIRHQFDFFFTSGRLTTHTTHTQNSQLQMKTALR